MKIVIGTLILFLGISQLTASINVTCSFIKSCPEHAECNPTSNFCVCKQGYIGDCNTPA